MLSLVKTFVLATLVISSSVALAPKPANAQWLDFGQQIWNKCASNPTGCAKVLQWPVDQIMIPQEIRGRNFYEKYQYDQELERQRYQDRVRNGEINESRGYGSYGGW